MAPCSFVNLSGRGLQSLRSCTPSTSARRISKSAHAQKQKLQLQQSTQTRDRHVIAACYPGEKQQRTRGLSASSRSRRTYHFTPTRDVQAAAGADAIDAPAEDEGDKWRQARIAASLCGWFFLNACFAIFNKKTLTVFPYPWLLSWIQIATGAALMLALWATKVFPAPEGGLTWKKCKVLLPTSILHLIAHVSACVSYKFSSVSITQVVKAAEPVCSVVLLTLFFGKRYSVWTWLSLFPVVVGVALSSATEINFSMLAFSMAMVSNIACAFRGVTSKQMQADLGLRGINLYAGIAIVSSVLLLPFSLLAEGAHLGTAFADAQAAMVKLNYAEAAWGFPIFLTVGSVLYHTYNQTSYQALAELSPLSHSIANTVKRVVIIVASVVVLKNTITMQGWIAAMVAVGGVFLYSLAQMAEKKAAK